MIIVQLFKDLPDKLNLPPLEITIQDEYDLITILTKIRMGAIDYDWNRIVITKG